MTITECSILLSTCTFITIIGGIFIVMLLCMLLGFIKFTYDTFK